jgi:hypothetical protein
LINVEPFLVGRLDEIATIEAAPDRNELREHSQSTRMIGVIVAHHEGVDLREACLLHHVRDPLPVAAVDLPARVVEQRLP